MEISLKGKTAIVTGAGRGIGRAVARMLAQCGANIVINDIPGSQDALDAQKEFEELGVGTLTCLGDVRSFSDAEKMARETLDKFKSIDILVNNAGITRDGLLMRMSEADWDDVLDINLKGAFNVTKAVIRPMSKQKSGAIVNMASVVGVMGNAGQVNYASSKAGLIGLTKSVAKEYASRNIRVNAVAPGFIQSKMTDVLPDEVKESYFKSIPLGRFGDAEDIAKTVLYLVSDLSVYITGQVIHIDGGLVM